MRAPVPCATPTCCILPTCVPDIEVALLIQHMIVTAMQIVSDMAARGLDVVDCDAVFNLEMPSDAAGYAHRAGRTARAGRWAVRICRPSQRLASFIKTCTRHSMASSGVATSSGSHTSAIC